MSKSIISVNGNKAMNYLLQTIFEQQYQFIPAADVFEGMHFLKTFPGVRALIIDLDTNSDEGWSLIHHIKSSTLYKVPVVVLASENTEELKQKSFDLSIDEIFVKPFNPVDLIAAINSLMNAETTVGY
jgi:DNA-binding response OmpR family regulator